MRQRTQRYQRQGPDYATKQHLAARIRLGYLWPAETSNCGAQFYVPHRLSHLRANDDYKFRA